MKRVTVIFTITLVLGSCGGSQYASHRATGYRAPQVATQAAPLPVQTQTLFARGPIADACRSARRQAATRARCGCVQAVADMELTAAQQNRGAGFFAAPHALQEVRQSSERSKANGRFWTAWKRFGARAEQLCKRA